MAATNPAARTPEASSTDDESGVGLAHLTVVPTNFDPDAPGSRRD